MNTRRLICTVLVYFAFISAVDAGNHSILFGGGCDDIEDTSRNPSYQPMVQMNAALTGRGWSAQSLYGDRGTRAQLLQALDEQIRIARAGESDHQLYIALVTHGRPRSDSTPHQICVLDADGNPSSMDIDDSEFTRRLATLRELGVELALSDGSCYSGASIEALSDYGCIVSNQSSSRPSYGNGIHESLVRLAQQGNDFSMEDLWMDTLFHDSTNRKGYPLQPSITGFPEGEDIGDLLAKLLITPRDWQDPGGTGRIKEVDFCKDRANQIDSYIQQLSQEVLSIADMAAQNQFRQDLQELTKNPNEPSLAELRSTLQQQLAEHAFLYEEYEQNKQKVKELERVLQQMSAPVDLSPLFDGLDERARADLRNELMLHFHLNWPLDSQTRRYQDTSELNVNGHELASALWSIQNIKANKDFTLWWRSREETMTIVRQLEPILQAAPEEMRNNANRTYHELRQARDAVELSVEQVQHPTTIAGVTVDSWAKKRALSQNINRARYYLYRNLKAKNPEINTCSDFKF